MRASINFKRKSCTRKRYEAKRQEERDQDRLAHGKKPFSPEQFEKEEMKELLVSTIVPESGYYVNALDNLTRDKKIVTQAMLTIAAMNLKKLAHWT